MKHLSRRDFIHAGCAVATATLVPSIVDRAEAGLHMHGTSGASAFTGRMVQNSGSDTELWYKNFMLNSFGLSGSAGTNWPSLLNANQYPKATASLTDSIQWGIALDPTYTGNYVIRWEGQGPGGSGTLLSDRGAPGFTVVSDPGSCVQGGTSFALNVKANAAITRLVVSLPGTAPKFINWKFLFGEAYDGTMGNLLFCRCSPPYGNGGLTPAGDELDAIAAQAGDYSRMFNADTLAKYATLNPKVLRFMGYEGINGSNRSQQTTQTPITAAFYSSPRWEPTIWTTSTNGAIGGSNNAYSCNGGSSTPGSFAHGEQIQGQFTNAQVTLSPTGVSSTPTVVTFTVASTAILTTGQLAFCTAPGITDTSQIPSSTSIAINAQFIITVTSGTTFTITGTFSGSYSGSGALVTPQPTINVAGRGAKPILNSVMLLANPTFAARNMISAAALSTLTYDEVFDSWICDTDTAATNTGVGLTPSPPIEALVAFCNKTRKDLWSCFPVRISTSEAVARAVYVRDHLTSGLSAYFEYGNENWNPTFAQLQYCINHGIKLGITPNRSLDYWALRVAQIFSGIGAIWSGGVGLKRTLAFQGAGDGSTDTFLFTGSTLNSSTAGALYTTLGYSNYDTVPNQPQNFSDNFSYAVYFSGAQAQQFDDGYKNNGSAVIADLLAQADNYAGLGPGTPTDALNWLDNDTRRGTFVPTTISTIAADGTITLGVNTNTVGIFTGSLVQLFTTGSLPTSTPQWIPTVFGTGGQIYYVLNAPGGGTTFKLSITRNGTAITSISGGSGAQSVGLTGQTMLLWATDRLNFWNPFAVTYNKPIACYEGGISNWYPTPATCTDIGIPTAYSQKILNLVEAYKDDARGKQAVLDQMTQFMTGSKSLLPGQLQVVGNNPWSHLKGYVSPDVTIPGSFAGDITCATFKTWDACVQFNA